jgi:hypothetical protein
MNLTIAPKTMGRAVLAAILVVVVRAKWKLLGELSTKGLGGGCSARNS